MDAMTASLEELSARADFWRPEEGAVAASFCTRRLREVEGERLEFRASPQLVLFCSVIVVLALSMAVAAALIALGVMRATNESGEQVRVLPTLFLLGMALLFGWLGVNELRPEPVVFDKGRGLFWRGRREEGGALRRNSGDEARLEDVLALQLLSRRVQRKHSLFLSWELNLVLRSGKRIHLVGHPNKEVIDADTERLGRFLDVPVLTAPLPEERETRWRKRA